eukprot:592126-Prorocentrum_minimum.AAC.1
MGPQTSISSKCVLCLQSEGRQPNSPGGGFHICFTLSIRCAMDCNRFAASYKPITRFPRSQREKVKSRRVLRRELESKREQKSANLAMEGTQNACAR